MGTGRESRQQQAATELGMSLAGGKVGRCVCRGEAAANLCLLDFEAGGK